MPCRCNNRLAFALGAWLAVTGGLLFFVFGHRYIPRYAHEGGFETVTCTVENVLTSGNFCCDATYKGMADCDSVIPCYQITVNYMPPGGSSNQSAYLYDDYRSYLFQAPNNNCSIYNCPSTFAETKTAGDALLTSYGQVGSTYPCHRNPGIPTEVLLTKTELSTVILSTLIPCIGLVIGIVICELGYKGRLAPCPSEWEEGDDEDDEKSLFEKVSGKGSSGDLHKAVENGELAQTTDEAATDDTHVENMSVTGSQAKLRNEGAVPPPPPPPAYESVA